MNEPWGMSGREFLLVYFLWFLAAMLIVLAVRYWARQSAQSSGVLQLSLYELAFLTRGKRGVTETAIAELLDSRAVRVQYGGKLIPTGAPAPDPLSAPVLSAIGNGRNVRRARKTKLSPSLITPIVQTLHGMGLIASPTSSRVAKLMVWLPAVVMAVGLVRMFNGIASHRPTGFLVLELMVSFFLLMWCLNSQHESLRTSSGKELAKRFTTRTQSTLEEWARTCPPGVRSTAIAPVAVLGLAAYPDVSISRIMRVSTSSGGSGDSGSSGGDSSGGGGCGGGGGGCGG